MADLSTLPPNQLEDFINNGGIAEVSTTSPKLNSSSFPPVQKPVEPQQSTTLSLTGLDIKNPVELLMILDEDVKTGKVKLHKWQIQILMDFSIGGLSDQKPLQQLVRACNGSGKDKYVIAPCVVWLCMAHMKARAVVTSSSGQQLDAQTCTYITHLCEAANRKFREMFGCDIWKINYRYYECLATGSPIDCFATDESKKAEGYHPLVAGGKMVIAVSEDKSVPDEINVALNKCTNYTHRLHVSTPALEVGHFYDYDKISVSRKEVKSVLEVEPTDWIQYKITAYDCSHLSKSYIEQMKRDLPGGESGTAFRSQVLAEFGVGNEMVVIPFSLIRRSINSHPEWKQKAHNDAGVDLSDGGDETVLAIRNGNRLLHVISFRFENTEDTIKYLDEQFRSYQLNNPHSRINADCGGLGKPMLDRLKRMGWSNIFYIDNRNKALQPKVYRNRAAELWFRFRKLLELNEIWLLDDHKLKTQLSTRYYKINNNIHQLESKIEARANGHPSPDRADAVILAYWEYEYTERLHIEEPFKVEDAKEQHIPIFSMREYKQRNMQPSRYSLHPTADLDDTTLRELVAEHNKRMTESESV